MKKFLVIGTSGSGKSTLARQISSVLGIPFFPSDDFYWEAGWKMASDAKVHEQIERVMACQQWVLDGNFETERQWVWKQSDCIVWLDYPLTVVLWQVLTRNLRWFITRQRTWSGNRMTFQRVLSGVRHTLKSYTMKKKNYPSWLAELPEAKVYRFSNRNETDNWLKGLRQNSR